MIKNNFKQAVQNMKPKKAPTLNASGIAGVHKLSK